MANLAYLANLASLANLLFVPVLSHISWPRIPKFCNSASELNIFVLPNLVCSVHCVARIMNHSVFIIVSWSN